MALYEKQYTGDRIVIGWRNYPDTATPISADNLQRAQRGIQAVDDAAKAAFDQIESRLVDPADMAKMITDVEFDRVTGRFVFRHFDNNLPDTVYDTVLEKVIVNFEYSAERQALLLTQEDGNVVEVSLSDFIAEPDVVNSDTIVWTISADGHAKADIADHSITGDKLQPDYLADIKAQVADTERNVKDATYYAQLSKSYANGTSNLQDRPTENVDNAKYYSEQSKAQARMARSYSDGEAVDDGGSPVREGQEEDNAKHYSELAAKNGESWAHGGVMNPDGTAFREGQDADNAEYWAKKASAVANLTIDGDFSDTSLNPLENRAITNNHVNVSIASEQGVHGLRYYDEELQVDVGGRWEDVTTGGGGGLELAEPTNVSITNNDESCIIRWTDPEDVTVSGIAMARWAGTVVVRKAGSAPLKKSDGVIVVDCRERNKHQAEGFFDSGLTNGETYYYGIFPYTTQKVYTTSKVVEFTPEDILPAPMQRASWSVKPYSQSVDVSFTPPADADGVQIWYAIAPASGEENYAKVEAPVSPHKITGLRNGIRYMIYVIPYKLNYANKRRYNKRSFNMSEYYFVTPDLARIKITFTSDKFVGQTVTVTHGDSAQTQEIDSTLTNTFECADTGAYRISNSLTPLAQQVEIDESKDYPISIGAAKLTVTALKEGFNGKTVTATQGTSSATATFANKTAELYLGTGEWTISNPITEEAQTVSITDEGDYSATVDCAQLTVRAKKDGFNGAAVTVMKGGVSLMEAVENQSASFFLPRGTWIVSNSLTDETVAAEVADDSGSFEATIDAAVLRIIIMDAEYYAGGEIYIYKESKAQPGAFDTLVATYRVKSGETAHEFLVGMGMHKIECDRICLSQTVYIDTYSPPPGYYFAHIGYAQVIVQFSTDRFLGQTLTLESSTRSSTRNHAIDSRGMTLRLGDEYKDGNVIFTNSLTSDKHSMPFSEIERAFKTPIVRFNEYRLNVTTDEPSLEGREVVATAPGNSATVKTTISSGAATLYVGDGFNGGTISCGGESATAEAPISVGEGTDEYSVHLAFVPIYGAEWDGGPGTKWSRTDAAAEFVDPTPAVANGTGSSPFDGIMPWAGMVRSDDPRAGAVVAIPKFYYKWTRSGARMKLQISERRFAGSSVSPAHADRGDGKGERSVVYIGRYKCVIAYKSFAEEFPIASQTRAQFRMGIHALRDDIWQQDFRMYWTLRMLYLVEFADWDSQAVIGYGCSPSGAVFRTGATDGMKHHTGTAAANRTTYGATQYRNIEGLWDNVFEWVDGINFNDDSVYVIDDPSKFADDTDDNATLVGIKAQAGGYISAWMTPGVDGYDWALMPSANRGSESMYVADVYYFNPNGGWNILQTGALYNESLLTGLFHMSTSAYSTTRLHQIGSRLMIL